MITIINYGLGNLASVKNIIKSIGAECEITSDIKVIEKAEKLILPGVGNFGSGMKNIRDFGLLDILNKKALIDKIPILGICLGMQLLSNSSEEDMTEKGLGWIDAKTIKFNLADKSIKIPHSGWTDAVPSSKGIPLFNGLENEARFYFVHSYHVVCTNSNNEMATSNYGEKFVCAIMKDNIMGVQFHPEKSHKFGMQLFENFIDKY